MPHQFLTSAALTVICTTLAACGTVDRVYYATWEKLGYEKRDLLVDQVEDARDQQEDAREQFSSALDQFKATFAFDGGEIEKAYNKLKKDYDRCQTEAVALRSEIASVKSIAGDLFDEWEEEIDTQTNENYKQLMTQQRAATLEAYGSMIAKMDEAAGRMDPVLQAFNERVLMLKSSLNAQAIAALETDTQELVGDIEALIAEMNESIAEADQFIASMGRG